MWPWPVRPDDDTALWPWPAGNTPPAAGPVEVEQREQKKIGRPKRDRAEIKRRRKARRRA